MVELLNLLHANNSSAMKAIGKIFFERFLPILSLTFSFVPFEQPLKNTDNPKSSSVNDSGSEDCPGTEEELFDEWKKHWHHLAEDHTLEPVETNTVCETIDGKRLYDKPLDGKQLGLLLQAASQLGFDTAVEQMFDLMVLRLGKAKRNQCHVILLAFIDTMLLRKIGRATLEKHKADIRAMIVLYFHHFLALPTRDMARPRIGCNCVRCRSLNKFLEDPVLETKTFVYETPRRHQHLLDQVQIAHYRFTWAYRYGPNHSLSGEERERFPDAWSPELRKKRFPEPWIANKGYKCTTTVNQGVQEITVTKTDKRLSLALENFQTRLEQAEQLKTKVEGSKLGGNLWTDALKAAQYMDRTEISQSLKMLKAEATARQLIAAFANPVQEPPTSVDGASNEQRSARSPLNYGSLHTTARSITSQAPARVAASQPKLRGVSTGENAVGVQAAKLSAIDFTHLTTDQISTPKGADAIPIAVQGDEVIRSSTLNGAEGSTIGRKVASTPNSKAISQKQLAELEASNVEPGVKCTVSPLPKKAHSPDHSSSSTIRPYKRGDEEIGSQQQTDKDLRKLSGYQDDRDSATLASGSQASKGLKVPAKVQATLASKQQALVSTVHHMLC